MTKQTKPLLAITMGDPAGVGPEVIVGAWPDARVHQHVRPFVVGHPELLQRAANLLHLDMHIAEVTSPSRSQPPVADAGTISCLRVWSDEVLDVPPGRVDARAGEAAYQAVRVAAELALHKQVDGIVTAPLSKAALHAAGHHYPGHTELLAEMCGVTDFAMMLYLSRGAGDWGLGARVWQKGEVASGQEVQSTEYAVPNREASSSEHPSPQPPAPSPGLGVAHVTLHQSLRSVFADLTSESIVAKCHLADGAMRRLGVAQPRLAVCALNPHAGEDGLFGDEERTIIAPAVVEARRAGLDVTGPLPTDTLMVAARDGQFDAVVAMYHDQGHIALKLLGMHAAVNITLGLPIVRTSVAHGTAFDRAWQGTANHEGMIAALRTAGQLATTI
ncbi:MAG: 4-hydroxythreonine-4-phosphate dehydrogenase PdxA [Pirellulales bacterium]